MGCMLYQLSDTVTGMEADSTAAARITFWPVALCCMSQYKQPSQLDIMLTVNVSAHHRYVPR